MLIKKCSFNLGKRICRERKRVINLHQMLIICSWKCLAASDWNVRNQILWQICLWEFSLIWYLFGVRSFRRFLTHVDKIDGFKPSAIELMTRRSAPFSWYVDCLLLFLLWFCFVFGVSRFPSMYIHTYAYADTDILQTYGRFCFTYTYIHIERALRVLLNYFTIIGRESAFAKVY